MTAIRLTPTPSVNTREYFHTKDTVKAIKGEVIGATQCSLELLGSCGRDIPVFADPTDEFNDYKNDIRSFILYVPTGATVTATLIHTAGDGTVTNYTITDNTYGLFYSTGTLKANVWGFILNFYKVQDVISFGCFKVNIVVANSSAVELSNTTTPCFKLRPWSCQAAHGTVRIDTVQTGYIENGFDYRGISYGVPTSGGFVDLVHGWPQQLHWYGRFSATTPTYINDVIVDSFRNSEQVQAQYVENYTLRLSQIQTSLSNPFFKDSFLANEIYVSDYNINNIDFYSKVRINPLDITNRRVTPMNPNQTFEIDLEEYQKATLKRN